MADFIADSARYWPALHAREDRLSSEAQTAAQTETLTWRSYARNSVTISGTDGLPE